MTSSMANVSLGAMLRQMAGIVDTRDVSDWENRFLKNVLERTGQGMRTSILTSDQAEKVEEIYGRHFG